MKRNQKVLLAMSGGVDSSVAACLLKERGYDVVGVFMRLGAEKYDTCSTSVSAGVSLNLLPSGGGATTANPQSAIRNPQSTKGCCSAADAADARFVAGMLDIPFYSLNFEHDFDRLVDYFVDEYAHARTPNPCIRCNQWLKFGRLVDYADTVGADLIATGHYARIEHDGPRPRLRRARYPEKDQSYVLFGIPLDVLDRTLFPLGEMTKNEVRDHARRFGLALHDKPESQDICFVPDGDYARLVRSRRADALRPGTIQHVDGRILGMHEGVANFTIGQRRGLRIAEGTPIYVTRLDAETDTVFVGPREAVLSESTRVTRVSWLREPPTEAIRANVQIRYHHEPAPARLIPQTEGPVRLRFDTPQSAITPGQAAVFYEGDEVLGGGWIEAL
ncbi:MAG: tRNA 2-thiouridine(34) synthase MnmA [Phycisphaerae bacterium]